MNSRATIKRWARRMVATATYFGGYCFLAELRGAKPYARILAYHSISDTLDNSFAVPCEDFARQIQFLVEHFTVMPVHEIVERLRQKQPLPPRTVAITIDDGFQDTYTNAYPILRTFTVPATVFLPTAFIGKRNVQSPLPASDFLSWDQVREMSQHSVAFGSHTVDHVPLTSLLLHEIQHQLERSRDRLETELGKPVHGLSYPYGAFNPAIQQLAWKAGYTWAVSGLSGINHYQTDVFALRRTKVERHDGLYIFRKVLHRALDPWILIDRYRLFSFKTRHKVVR